MSLIVLVVPFLVAFVMFLIIFVYRAIYRQNMNKALQGEATTGLIDIGSLLKTLTFIALLVMNVVALSKVSSLESQISNISTQNANETSSLRSTISSLRSQIDTYFQSQELVQDRDYTLSGADLENDLYTFDIDFTLLELETDSEVYLVIEHEGDSNRVLLSSTSLTYMHELELENDTEEYTLSVLIIGDTTTQKQLFTIDVERFSRDVIVDGLSFIESTEEFAMIVYILEDIQFVDNIKVDQVTFTVYDEGVLQQTVTLTSPTDMDSLLAPYEDYESSTVYEEGINTSSERFALLIDEDYHNLIIQAEIVLTDGTVIIRNLQL